MREIRYGIAVVAKPATGQAPSQYLDSKTGLLHGNLVILNKSIEMSSAGSPAQAAPRMKKQRYGCGCPYHMLCLAS